MCVYGKMLQAGVLCVRRKWLTVTPVKYVMIRLVCVVIGASETLLLVTGLQVWRLSVD